MKRKRRLSYITRYYYIPYLEEERRVRIILPASYKSTDQYYPVVYFHDGQNMLYNRESFSSVSWGLYRTRLELEYELECIFVLIDNSTEARMEEYSCWSLEGDDGQPLGDEYLDFIVEELKPDIDEEFRTLPERENTALIGSSMGALISAYGGARYNNVFGRLGIFSLCAFYYTDGFCDSILYHPIDPDTRVYVEAGTEEGNEEDGIPGEDINISQAYIDDAVLYSMLLLQKGLSVENVSLNIFHREEHSEYFWSLHLADCLRFLFCSEDRE